jgi:hypothetical protein
MRIFVVFLLLLIQLKPAPAQSFNDMLKSERKVVVNDSLDKQLNFLIDKNEILQNRGLTLNNFFIGWSEGEIFLKNNKTLKGRMTVVRDSKYSASPAEVILTADETEETSRYSANDINGFNKEGTIFRTKMVKNQTRVFIEIMEAGVLNLYFRKYIQPVNEGSGGIRIITEFFFEKTNNTSYLQGPVPNTDDGFIVFMESYIRDNPKLLQKIKNKVYTYDHIREIVQIYNSEKKMKN